MSSANNEVTDETKKTDLDRFCLFPIKEQKLWDFYKEQQQRFWTAEEIDFSRDLASWESLTVQEQHFVGLTLAFFANSDNVVIENLKSRFIHEMPWLEAHFFLNCQAFMEGIHVETYNLCIDVLIKNTAYKHQLFAAVKRYKVVRSKLEWAQKWISCSDKLSVRVIAFCIVEGVFFSSSFASIFWLRKRAKLPGVCFANEKIIEDECIHVKFGAYVYTAKLQPVDHNIIYSMMEEAVQIEMAFVDEAIPERLLGMNQEHMKQYVQNVADTILELLHVPKKYGVPNPFPWMKGIGIRSKSNFFEKRVAEYMKPIDEKKSRMTIVDLGSDL